MVPFSLTSGKAGLHFSGCDLNFHRGDCPHAIQPDRRHPQLLQPSGPAMLDTTTLDSPTTPISQSFRAVRWSFHRVTAWGHSWARRFDGVRDDSDGLHEYVELTRGMKPLTEMRLALVRIAHRMSKADRVELDLSGAPEGGEGNARPILWPQPEEPLWHADDRRTEDPGSRLCLLLRFGGRSHGTLRLITGRRRRWSPRLVRQLTTLCALAAANERAWGAAGDDDAARDPVTGVYNATFMNAFLTQALSQARRRGESLAILCMGVDWLSHVRDEHGVEIADAALRRMARAMVATLRTSDVVARSDECRLIAVLPSATMIDAFRVAESVRRAVLEAGVTAATANPLSTAIGVAAYPDHAVEVGPLLAAAGEALARAHAQGPGSIISAPRSAKPLTPSIVRSVG